eukprot:gene436-96_t
MKWSLAAGLLLCSGSAVSFGLADSPKGCKPKPKDDAATAAVVPAKTKSSASQVFLQVDDVPGAGSDLGVAKQQFAAGQSLQDGYSEVACLNEGMRYVADLHENKLAYKNEDGTSIVWYHSVVPKEDAKKMTRAVCFDFCKTIEHMNFFGLTGINRAQIQ